MRLSQKLFLSNTPKFRFAELLIYRYMESPPWACPELAEGGFGGKKNDF